jgi:hypothetical protein
LSVLTSAGEECSRSRSAVDVASIYSVISAKTGQVAKVYRPSTTSDHEDLSILPTMSEFLKVFRSHLQRRCL